MLCKEITYPSPKMLKRMVQEVASKQDLSRTQTLSTGGLEQEIRNVLKIEMAPSSHKDSTPSGMRCHAENVKILKSMVRNDH